MDEPRSSVARDAFLAEFFGAVNRLSLDLARDRPRLRELVDAFDSSLTKPAVLPRMRPGPGTIIDWYLMAGTDDDLRRCEEEVDGFIGPTYARWNAVDSAFHRDDPVDALVLRTTHHRARKF